MVTCYSGFALDCIAFTPSLSFRKSSPRLEEAVSVGLSIAVLD